MKSQITSRDKRRALNKNRGFTLLEMILVVALVTILGGLGLYFGFDSLRRYSFHSDRDVLISVLQHARAQAVSNVCRGGPSTCSDGKPHGVKILDEKFVIFQGTDYESDRDEDHDAEIDAHPATIHSGIDEIVFEQLSGNASPVGDITLTDTTGRTSVISINSEGQILWTN